LTRVLQVVLVLGLAVAAKPQAAHATPSLDACTGVLHRQAGTTEPIAITAPGTWCLDQDMVEGVDSVGPYFAMVAIDVDDVTLDCRGHRIVYTGSADTAYGVVARGPGTLDRIKVRNCHLLGFSNAIALGPTRDFLVEDNTVHASRPNVYGLASAVGSWGEGIVRRNRIRDSINRAIAVAGGSQVLDNFIDGVAGSADWPGALGIEVSDAAAAVVRGNIVRGLASSAPNQVMAVAISSAVADGGTVVTANVMVHDGSEGPIGIFCDSSARVADNVIAGFFAPLVAACVDTGDNDASP
jgi:hypothetical protein